MRAKKEKARGSAFSSRTPKKGRGFTLVELLVVISIIVVLASLAIPAALRTRLQSNETATVGNLRTISSAAESYRSTQNPPAYPPDFATMVNSNPAYLDTAWLSNQRQGYIYTFASAQQGETYGVTATPRIPNVTGVNAFCVDHTAVIRSYPGGGAAGNGNGCDPSGTPI